MGLIGVVSGEPNVKLGCRLVQRYRLDAALLLVFLGTLLSPGMPATAVAQESSENAIAAYADAASMQTNAAFDAAIDAWRDFLKAYPQDPLASKAAHYLGVCLMQRNPPDYTAAADAFATALKTPKYDLREESLANQGWSLFAAAGEQGNENAEAQKLLNATLQTFTQLEREFPKSQFLDQAYFHAGEAAYALKDGDRAIAYYEKLLKSPLTAKSPLRCDAFYAKGVAEEEQKQYDQALASYRSLLENCDASDADLSREVLIRSGDILLLQGEPEPALGQFDKALQFQSDQNDYPLFRRAFALAKLGRSAEAAAGYERLLQQYPDSPYTSSAILSAAQSLYVAGDLENAAKRFQQVLQRENNVDATEAAHWLAQIALQRDDPQTAQKTAAQQIMRGVQGPYALALKYDHAEATSLLPDQTEKAVELYALVFREAPKDPLAARALYGAAFTTLQAGDFQKAFGFATQFLRRFPENELQNDVRYIAAESQLQAGQPSEALKLYRQLLERSTEDPQLSAWVLRAATAAFLAGEHDVVSKLIEPKLDVLSRPAQQAEAQFLIGASHLSAQRPKEAIAALQAAGEADSRWNKADETLLLLGQAYQQTGDEGTAKQTWETLIKEFPQRRMTDQALYRLGQLAAEQEDYSAAIKAYQQIAANKHDPPLVPYALFNQAFCLSRQAEHKQALSILNPFLGEFQAHPLRAQAKLLQGVSLRATEQLEEAEESLQDALESNPSASVRGNALFELAQIEQQRGNPNAASKWLTRLIKEVPGYPTMESVMYELAWSHQESGDQAAAAKAFEQLVNRYPDHALAAEGHFYIAERKYEENQWESAARSFALASARTDDAKLAERARYNRGWSLFRMPDYSKAEAAFLEQTMQHPEGELLVDGLLMVGEARFKRDDFAGALEAYRDARKLIEARDESAKTIDDADLRRIRELVYLHGGQSLAQIEQWQESSEWLKALKTRFPTSQYLPQVFFQLAYAQQQMDNDQEALELYGQVAGKYRDEIGARSRFMMGEIYFGRRDLAKAISEFQRVMFGFGADQAPPETKNWQAKSGFEAGRCAELLLQTSGPERRTDVIGTARKFYEYVLEKHPQHELVPKAKERLEVLKKL